MEPSGLLESKLILPLKFITSFIVSANSLMVNSFSLPTFIWLLSDDIFSS